MNSLTLKQLRYFDALARHRHFGRAAESCAISQPALSLQIKDLETLFGVPLVERGAREIRLTSVGENVVRKARELLVSVDELENLTRASRGRFAGRFRLGVIPTVAPYFLPATIRALTTEFPEIDLELRESVTRSLVSDLLDSRLDAAIVALPISEPALQEFALFQEDFVLVRPARDASNPVPGPDMLKSMRLLLLEEGHCFRDQALSFCEISKAQPRQLMEGSSLSTLVQMVGAGMGVTLIPEMAVPLETRSAQVAIARFPDPTPTRTIGMVWRKSNPLVAQLERVGSILRGLGATVPSRQAWVTDGADTSPATQRTSDDLT